MSLGAGALEDGWSMAIQVTMATLQASPTRHYHTDEISGQEYLPNTYLNLGGRSGRKDPQGSQQLL